MMPTVSSQTTTFAVRNLAGAAYPANRYRRVDIQAAGVAGTLATGADVLLLQEATGVGRAFALPDGWRMAPNNQLDRCAGSVVAAASHVDMDVSWRPRHPILDAFDAYLDFGLLSPHADPIAVVSVHAPAWRDPLWASTGLAGGPPAGYVRPWTSDVILDALLEVLEGRPAILAGDWNESPNYPTPDNPGTRAWFDRVHDAGLVEAVAMAFQSQVRTNFCRGVKRSYQNDHVFLTGGLAERLRSVAVWNEPGAPTSDHAGIVITLG